MKSLLLLCIIYSNALFSQTSIYNLSVTSISGKNISLGEYKGRKILIATINVDSIQEENVLRYWDSLQIMNPKVAMILLPATDTVYSGNSILWKNYTGSVLLSEKTPIKKSSGINQNPIMQWLTDPAKNSHFNADVETDSQFYFISESGVLFAVLNKGTGQPAVDNILKQADIKQQSVISAAVRK